MADTDPLLPKIRGERKNEHEVITREQYVGHESRDSILPLSRDRYGGYESIDSPMVTNPGILGGLTPIADVNLQDGSSSKIPSDYSGYAWLSLLFCFFPLSLAAIYYSNKVLKCIRRGDLNDAWRFSVAAKRFSTLAIIYGILLIIIAVTLYFVVSAQSRHS